MLPTPPRKGVAHAEKRRKRSPEVKAEIDLEAVKGLMTTSKIASSDEVHPTQLSLWKKEFLEHACDVFDGKHRQSAEIDLEQMPPRHHAKIGQLTLDVGHTCASRSLGHQQRA
jgi:transposase-like protein